MKTLELKPKVDGKVVKVHLRLNAGGQRKLKEETGEETMTAIMGAISDIDTTILIFDIALNYKDNDNTITDGEELYDILVDNDYCGNGDFAKVLTDIAIASGIIKKDQANSLVGAVNNTYDNVFNKLSDMETMDDVLDAGAEKKETPSDTNA